MLSKELKRIARDVNRTNRTAEKSADTLKKMEALLKECHDLYAEVDEQTGKWYPVEDLPEGADEHEDEYEAEQNWEEVGKHLGDAQKKISDLRVQVAF